MSTSAPARPAPAELLPLVDQAERSWLTSEDPAWLFEALDFTGCLGQRGAERKLRLLACAALRAAWPELPSGWIGLACQAAERYADAKARGLELIHAQAACGQALRAGLVGKAWPAAAVALHALEPAIAAEPELFVLSLGAHALELGLTLADLAHLVRDLFGNPFRLPRSPVTAGWLVGPAYASPLRETANPELQHHAAAWGSAVLGLARDVYDYRRPNNRMPTLAAALARAGCADVEVLAHARGHDRCARCLGGGDCSQCGGAGWVPSVVCPDLRHARGCWLIDLLLGY